MSKRRKHLLELEIQAQTQDVCSPPISKRNRMDPNAQIQSQPDYTIHPLLIDHVLEQIFSHLYKKSDQKSTKVLPLLNCRLVCKTWHQIATKVHRDLQPEEIQFSFNDTNKFHNFLEAMQNTELLPFRKFQFDVNFFIKENEELFLKFLENLSPSITNLNLLFGKNFSMSFLNKKFSSDLVNFENLKSLKFNCTYVNTRNPTNVTEPPQPQTEQCEGLLNLLRFFFKSATNLEALDFCVPSRHFGDSFDPRFGHVVAQSIPKSVKEVKLITEISIEDLDTMKDLILDKLHINFYGSESGSSPSEFNVSFYEFLKSQSVSLTQLYIADLENQRAEELTFPLFPNLTTLEIKGGNHSTFGYLGAFPKLEKLVLRNARKRNGTNGPVIPNEPPNGNLPSLPLEPVFNSVKDIQITISDHEYISPSLISQIAKSFPNLQKFQLPIRKDDLETLKVVFVSMKNLEELFIGFSHFFGNLAVDTILTGIPVEDCREMLEKKSFDLYHHERTDPDNLCGLKRLKKLTIKAVSYAVVVTNVTAHHALLQMPRLEKLVMEQFNITRDYFDLLKARFEVEIPKSTTSSEDRRKIIHLC